MSRFLADESNAQLRNHDWGSTGWEIPKIMDSRGLIDVGFLSVKYKYLHQDEIGQAHDDVLTVKLFTHPIMFIVASVRYRISWFKKTVSDTHFGDGLMPLLITVIALVLYLVNVISR